MTVQIRVSGMDRILKKLSPELVAPPLRRFLERSAETVRSGARRLSPVDMGLLRASLAWTIDKTPGIPTVARVGSNVKYAPYMEYGTGLLAEGDPAKAKGGRHFPPAEALARWAQLHGMGGMEFVISRAIARRGGLEPRRFLRRALAEAHQAMRAFLEQAAREIGAAWERR